MWSELVIYFMGYMMLEDYPYFCDSDWFYSSPRVFEKSCFPW